jgi:beta-mannosidase
VPISITVVHAPFTALNNLTGSVEIFDDRFQPLWRQQRQIGVTPGPSVTRRELGEFSIPQEFRDKYFFVVAELKSADGKLLSRSVYCPRSLKMMEDPAFRQKYRATPQPSLHFDHGPWLRKQVEAVPTSLALEVVSQKDVGENRSHAEVRLRNTGSCTAFFTHINIEGTKRAFYGSDNFFWLPAGEERRLEFEVLWRDPATRNKAVWTVRAWNANAAQATRSP